MDVSAAQDAWVNPRDPARAVGPDGQPARSRRAAFYAGVPDEQWDDWRWQLSNRVNDLATFAHILELTDEERDGLGAPDKFRVDITPYFLSLIDPADAADPDPSPGDAPRTRAGGLHGHDGGLARRGPPLAGARPRPSVSRPRAHAGDHPVRLVLPLLHALTHRRRRHPELQHPGLRGAAGLPGADAPGPRRPALGRRPADHRAEAPRARAARTARHPPHRDRPPGHPGAGLPAAARRRRALRDARRATTPCG